MKQLVLLLALLFFLSCKTTQQKTVKQYLSLTNKEYKSIKKDKEIINGLYLLLSDSIDVKKIKDPLKSYFVDYNKDKLMVTVEMYSVLGNKITIGKAEKDSTNTNTNVLRVNSLDELKAFKKERDKLTEKRKKEFNEKHKKKDSL